MGQIILGFIGAYLLYLFIFNFLIPLVRVTRQVRRQVRNFREQVNTQQSGFPPNGYQSGNFQSSTYNSANSFGTKTRPASKTTATAKEARKDDYIDFEEI